MPYGPVRQAPREDSPLTDSEREQRIKDLQAEQERRLRDVLGDDLYGWLQDFEQATGAVILKTEPYTFDRHLFGLRRTHDCL